MHGDSKDEEDVPIDGTAGYVGFLGARRYESLMTLYRSSKQSQSKGKGRADHVFDLVNDMHAAEAAFAKDQKPAHKFEVGGPPFKF